MKFRPCQAQSTPNCSTLTDREHQLGLSESRHHLAQQLKPKTLCFSLALSLSL